MLHLSERAHLWLYGKKLFTNGVECAIFAEAFEGHAGPATDVPGLVAARSKSNENLL